MLLLFFISFFQPILVLAKAHCAKLHNKKKYVSHKKHRNQNETKAKKSRNQALKSAVIFFMRME